MIIEALKAFLIGIVEGSTEWLPISSTGHMILVDEFVKLQVSDEFLALFLVVIQLGAIMAVLILYFHKLNPFSPKKDAGEKKSTWRLWGMVAIGCIPAALTGLAAGTPVVGGAGDNAAAAVGTGVVADGKAFTPLGTSGVVFAHTDNISIDPQGRVHTFCCAVPGAWHVMGVTQAAGLSLTWFRDNFCAAEKEAAASLGVDAYALLNREAAQSPIGANKLLYAPYLMGERTPHLDADCRGMFFGLSGMHQRRDLLRAVMEAVTYSLKDCLNILSGMGVQPAQMLACGGGGKSPFWRQMPADVFDCPVATTVRTEGPALGVAILAGVGAGLYPSVEEACREMIRVNPAQQPMAENVPQYARVYEVYRKLYGANRELFKELAKL